MGPILTQHPWLATALSTLQLHAVTPGTTLYYVAVIEELFSWMQAIKVTPLDAAELDQVIVRFFDQISMEGAHPTFGDKLLAGLLHVMPDLGSTIKT
eukprot:8473164-Karenia_brevis.AAC.1